MEQRTWTTGEVVRRTGLTEKALWVYDERGLLRPGRDAATGARRYDAEDVRRARLIGLLRGLELPLAVVASVLDADDPAAAFDEAWSDRRLRQRRTASAAEYVRGVLTGTDLPLPALRHASVPERLVLVAPASATLTDLPTVVPELTGRLFDLVRAGAAELAGAPYVSYRGRATATFPSDVRVVVPVDRPVRPAPGVALEVDPAHDEASIPLTQAQATPDGLLLAAHDRLSSGRPSDRWRPAGDNREVYLPTFGTGAAGVVMHVAVPVVAAP